VSHDVFVSYAHHDKPQADAVCAALEARGIRCWIAPRDVVPGREWGAAIVEAIRTARVMVLVFSSHANASPQVRREVERAVNAETVLIPFRIEDVVPAESLEFFLGTPHWLDALTPPLEAHLERLTTAVASFVTVVESLQTTTAPVPYPILSHSPPPSVSPVQPQVTADTPSKPISAEPRQANVAAKNKLAVWSLVASFVGLPSSAFTVGYALAIAGIVMGAMALKQIKVTHQMGRRRAIAGIILGVAGLVVMPTALLIKLLIGR
jgi:TIR domain/Domain of unknown function (DUF4190)